MEYLRGAGRGAHQYIFDCAGDRSVGRWLIYLVVTVVVLLLVVVDLLEDLGCRVRYGIYAPGCRWELWIFYTDGRSSVV